MIKLRLAGARRCCATQLTLSAAFEEQCNLIGGRRGKGGGYQIMSKPVRLFRIRAIHLPNRQSSSSSPPLPPLLSLFNLDEHPMVTVLSTIGNRSTRASYAPCHSCDYPCRNNPRTRSRQKGTDGNCNICLMSSRSGNCRPVVPCRAS